MIRRQNAREGVKLTFALPAEAVDGRVSVVGDFNGWTPGRHPLVKRSNGTRSAVVTVPGPGSYRFRYLGESGHWFNDADADAFAGDDGVVTV